MSNEELKGSKELLLGEESDQEELYQEQRVGKVLPQSSDTEDDLSSFGTQVDDFSDCDTENGDLGEEDITIHAVLSTYDVNNLNQNQKNIFANLNILRSIFFEVNRELEIEKSRKSVTKLYNLIEKIQLSFQKKISNVKDKNIFALLKNIYELWKKENFCLEHVFFLNSKFSEKFTLLKIARELRCGSLSKLLDEMVMDAKKQAINHILGKIDEKYDLNKDNVLCEIRNKFNGTNALQQFRDIGYTITSDYLSQKNWYLGEFSLINLVIGGDHLNLAKLLIEARIVDLENRDKDGKTVLHAAVEKGSELMIDLILAKEKDLINSRDSDKMTALHYAVLYKNINLVGHLIEKGADIEARDCNGETPLHRAMSSQDIEMVEYLIVTHKADIKVKNSYQRSLLHNAVICNDMGIVNFLLTLEINDSNQEKETSSHSEGNEQTQEVSTTSEGNERCQDTVTTSESNAQEQETSTAWRLDINAQDQYGDTPLHYAVKDQNIEMVGLLLDRGAKIDIKNANGKNPFHVAVSDKSANIDIIKLFLEKDKNLIEIADSSGRTPICLVKHTEITEQLLHYGANIYNSVLLKTLDSSDENSDELVEEMSPLHVLAKDGNTEMVKFALACGADIYSRSSITKRTSLHFAAESGYTDLIEILTRTVNRPINCVDNDGRTPLHFAKDVKSISVLLELGAEVNAQDVNGRTILHSLASVGSEVGIRTAIEYGANPWLKDKDGVSPVNLSKSGYLRELNRYLIAKYAISCVVISVSIATAVPFAIGVVELVTPHIIAASFILVTSFLVAHIVKESFKPNSKISISKCESFVPLQQSCECVD